MAKLTIISLHNKGASQDEYILLEATEVINLHNYAVCDATYLSNGKRSNKLKHWHWFASRRVGAGELVKLWTKKGSYEVTTDILMRTVHNVYWGLDSAIWNNTGDEAILFNLAAIDSKKV